MATRPTPPPAVRSRPGRSPSCCGPGASCSARVDRLDLGHGVERGVDVGDVDARTAVDRLAVAVGGVEEVGAAAAVSGRALAQLEVVVAGAAVDGRALARAAEHVVAATAVEHVLSGTGDHLVVAA